MLSVRAGCRLVLAGVMLQLGVMESALAETGYAVNNEFSSVSFATIKKQYVVEPAVFKEVSGSVNAEGEASFSIALSSVDTNNPIRDERLQKLFFMVDQHPQATISAKVDPAVLQAEAVHSVMEVPAMVTLYGQAQEVNLAVMLTKTADGFMLTSRKPMIISAANFEIPDANLKALSGTVDSIALSTTVAVNFAVALVKQ